MSTRYQAIIVFLLALAISVPVALSCGGSAPISDLNSPEVQDAAKFAVSEFNKQQGKIMNLWKPLLQYRKIVRGESQLVAGWKYTLVVLANDGKSEGLYEAVVYDVPWLKLKELVSFKKVMMATLLFIIPNKKKPGEKLMDWNKCKKLPWNIVLLLGAGFANADGVRTSGLTDILSDSLAFLEKAPYLAIAPIVCLISSTITEFTSNNATTTLLVPLLIQIAETMHVHPLLLMIPGAIGAQFAFLLPTGTPSNVVGFTTGHIEIRDMIRTGLPLKVAGIVALSFLMPSLGTIVFGTDRTVLGWKLQAHNCK